MKKNYFLTLIFLLTSFFSVSAQCDHIFVMNDSYGDGWNGASVDIVVDGEVVAAGIAAADAGQSNQASTENFAFTASTDSNIELANWVAGSWPSEISFQILDGAGTEIAAGSFGDLGISVGYCPPPPTCDHTFVMNDSYGDGWNGATVDLSVDGVVIAQAITPANAGGAGTPSTEEYTFSAQEGSLITLSNWVIGSWDTEISWSILDGGAGLVLASGVHGDFADVEANCTAPACPSPQVNLWSMTSDGAEFDGYNQDAVTGYEIHYSTSDFTLGDDSVNVYEFESFPHTMSGVLEGSTTYYMTIRSVCGDGVYSDWEQNPNNNGNGPDIYTTSSCQSSYSLPYFNDFGEYDEATGQPSGEAITNWSNCNSFYNLDDDNPNPGYYNFWFLLPIDLGDGPDVLAASYSLPDYDLDPDNWFVLGPIDLTNEPNAMLTWDMLNGNQPDTYSVYVGTSNSTEDFLESSLVSYEETTTETDGNQMNAKELDISAAVGNEVYIAFRHHDSAGLVAIGIDNVSVTSNTMSNEDFELENIDYTFNQETDILKVNSDELLSNLEIFNIMGQKVLYQNLNDNSAILNLSTLSSGVYIVNVEGNNSKMKTFKLAIN